MSLTVDKRELFYRMMETLHIRPYRRGMIAYLESQRRDKDYLLEGVEIGICEGRNSLQILERLPMGMLYLVDPFMPWMDVDTYRDADFQMRVKSDCMRRLKGWDEYYMFIERTSVDAYPVIVEAQHGLLLDFVYIDGDHSFEHALEDIKLYYPFVRKGGVVGGHDWHIPEVAYAVCRFCMLSGIDMNSVHAGIEDWFIVKE